MPKFLCNKINFRFEQFGTGPPFVGCHGLTGDLLQVHELFGELHGYSLTLWDARGHGETEPVGSANLFTFEQFSQDLKALLTHLGHKQVVIGGVSMGAGVATRFALNWPEMVRGLILIRPAWLDQPFPNGLRLSVHVGELLAQFGATQGLRRFQVMREYQQLKAEHPSAAETFCGQFDQPYAAERSARLRMMPASCPIHNWDELSKLRMPTLVMGCDPDYVHPFAYAAEWAQRLPSATLVQVPPKNADLADHSQAVQRAAASFLNSL